MYTSSKYKKNVYFNSFYVSIIVVWVSWYIIPILTRSQHISCWLVLFDAWMKVLATPSSSPLISHTESLLQKRILHFGGSYYPFVNMHKNSPQKFWLWGSAPYALASSNWKTDSRSLCHFWKNVGSNYLTRRTDF